MAGRVAASILVRLVDEASKPAGRIAKALRDIQAAAKATKSGRLDLKGGPGSARGLDAMTRSAGRLTRELREAAKAAERIRLPAAAASPFRGMRRDVAGLLKDLERARALSAKIGSGGRGGRRYRAGPGEPPDDYHPRRGRSRYGHYDGDREAGSHLGVRALTHAGRGAGRVAQLAGRVGADSMREDARDYLAGLSEVDTKKFQNRSLELSAQYPSVDQRTLHEMLRDTTMSMGSVDKAFENADSLGRMATVLQSLKGKDKAIEQVRQFYSGLDVLGKNVDPKQVERLSDAYTRALGVEGAEMDMGKVLAMAKQSRSAGGGLSDKFLMTTAPALMQDLGHHQTGTALASMTSQIIGGRSTKASVAYQQELGMRDKKGRISAADKAQITSNPFEYTMKRLIPLLEKKGISPDDDGKVIEAMSKAFSNRTVADLFTKMITQRAQYLRKEEQYDKAPGLAAADSLRRRDPYVAGAGTRAQAENVLNEAVKPYVPTITEGLNKLTDALGATAKSMGDNPDATKIIAPAVAGITASIGSWLAGQTLLSVAGNSPGLWAGAARLAGTGLTAAGTATGVLAPLAGATAAGAAMQEGDTRTGGWLRGAITGKDTPLQGLLRENQRRYDQRRTEVAAVEVLKGRGLDFSTMRAGTFGNVDDPVATPYRQSRGAFLDFLHGPERGTADLPGFGFQGREDGTRGPPRRPVELGGRAPSAGPAADATLPDASKIADATAVLAKYQAELAGVRAQLDGLKASGEGAFSAEATGLEARKAELEEFVSDAKAKLEGLNQVPASPKGDASGLAPLDAGADATKGKLSALDGTRVSPRGDVSGLAPLDSAAEATRGKLSALDGTTVSPKGDASGLAVLESTVDRILSKIGQIGGKAAAAQGQVAGLSAVTGRARDVLGGLERSKQTSMTSSPV